MMELLKMLLPPAGQVLGVISCTLPLQIQTELPRELTEWRLTEIKVEREREKERGILAVEMENERRT